ncbi:4Fe-4S binding protein [Sansalvadorimonas verongulae]|uniref:4Fe-4S binding protein n=1 Tax=Sansalvadorimonas verongulae TaxID=2172824 RepID=UPI0012BB4B1E|nr:4Fe-4S binding protein [Sansalvadorimonas verongulae]MTI15350.1 4Fe-4S dicluster domain-containing protein [Sansalvadorimonas verongulae]
MEEASKEEVRSPSRRNFFKHLAQPQEIKLPETFHPRPPWSCDNKTFLSLCDRCNLCIDACPQKVLRKSEETDPVLKKLPVLILECGSCDFCGKCVEVCPTDALSKENGRQAQAVAVVSGNCSPGYGYPCQMCVEACEVDAITPPSSSDGKSDRKKARVDTERCTGCGECVLSCYNYAISMEKRA